MMTFGKRLWLLVLLVILGLCLPAGLSLVVGRAVPDPTRAVRITMIAQMLLAFILPAVVMALFVTRLPAEFLMIKQKPCGREFGLALLTLLVSIPAMNCLVELFQQLPWPQSVLDGEAQAQAAVTTLMGPHTIPNFIASLLIMSLLTGLSEELLFRGALMRTLHTRPMPAWGAVWMAAMFFSFMHFQPVGFVPRLLLGAYLGYVTLWSGSLWTAIACHALNNAIVVTALYLKVPENFVGLQTPLLSGASLCLTVMLLWGMWRCRVRED